MAVLSLSIMEIKSYLAKKLRKITPIQAFIILVVIAGAVFVVKFFGKQPEWRLIRVQVIGKDWSNTYDNEGYRPPYWLVESVNEGDVELSAGGGKLAEVVKVESYKRAQSDYDLYLTLRVNGVLNAPVNKYTYKGRAIEVGAPISLRLNNTLIFAQVIDAQVPEEGYEAKDVVVTGRFRNAEPWIISNLKVNDEMTNVKQGEVVAEILSIAIEPAQSRLVVSGTRSLIFQRNPRLRDIVLRVKLVVEKHGEEWYFGVNQNIKAGNTLRLSFPEVDLLSIEVESVEDVTSNESAK